MNREQMIAWLALEGWELYREADDRHLENIIRNIGRSEAGLYPCDMLTLNEGKASLILNATAGNMYKYKSIINAPIELLARFIDAMEKQNEPD